MVVQYPHLLTSASTNPATRDANGDWVEGTNAASVTLSCRAEPANGTGFIQGIDGTAINYEWIVYMPLSSNNLVIGQQVSVSDNGLLILNEAVKRYSRGQLNARAWL